MTEIVDFELLKKQRFVEKECSLRQRENIDQLVDEQTITIKEHAALIQILKVFEAKHLEPKDVFRDVFELKRKEFEQTYRLEWWYVVKHCLIFLKVLKENAEVDYELFFEES